jgi:two-component system, OmpR family, response regulator
MNPNSHILVVDDQPEICELVRDYLTSEGYMVRSTNDRAGMRRIMAQDPVDLVILDLILPDEDGLTLARWLRENFRVGIIMLTGRGEIVDHILGLEMGADYYVTKPYHQRQLLATVNAVLRRLSTQTTEKQTSSGSKARFARWELNFSIRELFSPSGDVVPLTTGDFELLAAFVNNPNQVLARDHLFDLARNREAEQFGRTIDVQVSRLRRKIEDDPEKPEMIKTVRGRGYMFTPTVKWI